jgi:deoxyribonuclease IV
MPSAPSEAFPPRAIVAPVLIGAHVSTAGGIDTAIDRIAERGGDAVQLFTQSPRMWRPTAHDPPRLARFRERRHEEGIGYAVCHALYLINLASADPDLFSKSLTALVTTLDVAREIEADVVVHVGSHLGAGLDASLDRITEAIEEALEHTSDTTWLLLENSAGAGGTIGRSLAELATVAERIGMPPRLGLCLDSCHLYVSGVDVTDPDVVAAVLNEVDATFGLDRLRLLHVNDAATPLGSNRDRHANIGEGEMGEALGALLGNPRVQSLPAILETPGGDGHGPNKAEIDRLRELHRRALKGRRKARRAH